MIHSCSKLKLSRDQIQIWFKWIQCWIWIATLSASTTQFRASQGSEQLKGNTIPSFLISHNRLGQNRPFFPLWSKRTKPALKSYFIYWKSLWKSEFLSVTVEYISICFGIDLRAFIPTSYPPPTHPKVKLSILPSHMLPTLLSIKLKHLINAKEEYKTHEIYGAATM